MGMLLKGGKEYICSCYYSRNIFLKSYSLHVSFKDRKSFEEEFRQILRFRGCSTDKQFQNVLDEISREVESRKAIHQLIADRTRVFRETYQRLHPDIWKLKESYFDKCFLNIFDEAKSQSTRKLLSAIYKNGGTVYEEKEVYQFPVFTADFCRLLMQEVEKFKSSPEPKTRPNTMNKYGISLEEMGFSQSFLNTFLNSYLAPFSAALFPAWGGASIDSFKAFLVNYEMHGDIDLAEHYDNAEVTINISLTESFDEGDISFSTMYGEEIYRDDDGWRRQQLSNDDDLDDFDLQSRNQLVVSHKLGHGILHCGRRMHQALPIKNGTRTNLIIWMRSSAIRNQQCPMCLSLPNLLPVPVSGEGFSMVDVCCCS